MNPEPLIHQYLDGTISAEDMANLSAILLADPAARRTFTELLNLDSALAEASADWAPARKKVIPFPTAPRWLAAAACLALLAITIAFWPRQPTFATVQKIAGVEELTPGTPLHRTPHEIKAGTLELVTTLGARIVIEAPAAFRFESPQRLHLTRGRLAADVPPSAKGFTVITPSGDAIDLGTRFGVDVPASGPSEIHVFQGEVIAKTTGAKTRQNLRDGQALTMNQGTSASRDLRSSAFIQPDEISGLSAGLAAGQRARSEAALAQLKTDPALITLLDFESNTTPHPGTYRIVQGRWPGSKAPEFIHIGDHLKLNTGGDRSWPRLTLAAWVRIDRLDASYQSLLHTDGWNDQTKPGQVHWMINKNATMRLALYNNTLAPGSDETQGFPDSLTPVLPEQGRWVHLAAVYDSEQRTARFYLNGRFDKQTRLQTAHPARLGSAQIGNWNSRDRKLSGRIDEFLILGRAMTGAEIQTLFTAGNPYR